MQWLKAYWEERKVRRATAKKDRKDFKELRQFFKQFVLSQRDSAASRDQYFTNWRIGSLYLVHYHSGLHDSYTMRYGGKEIYRHDDYSTGNWETKKDADLDLLKLTRLIRGVDRVQIVEEQNNV